MRYEAIPALSVAEVTAAVQKGDAGEVTVAVLSASLHATEWEWAQGICVQQMAHKSPAVRGAALIGMAHIARIHRKLDRAAALSAIEAGLHDPDPHVRGQAEDAADEVETFLGWRVLRPEGTNVATP